METIINIITALISIGCAFYCGFQVSFIKNKSKVIGDKNANLTNSSSNYVNTGDNSKENSNG